MRNIWIQIKLDDLIHLTTKRKFFNFKIGMAENKRRNKMLEIKINNEQKINVTLSPVTSSGKVAALDGKPEWTIMSGTSTIAVSEDGLTATLISTDDAGDTTYMVQADADLGDGVLTISDTILLHVQSAQAASLGLVVGVAEPK